MANTVEYAKVFQTELDKIAMQELLTLLLLYTRRKRMD